MKIKCKICKAEDDIVILKCNDICFPICNICLNFINKCNIVSLEEYNVFLKNKTKIYNKKYKANHKDKQKEYKENYKKKHNLESINDKEYMKKYREEHKEYFKEYSKKYAQKKKEERKKIKKLKEESDNKINEIKQRTRCLINKCFVRKGYRKNTKTEKLLGCDFNTFYQHLIQTFEKTYGYQWDGIEKVDIDHIIPLATAKSEEEVINLCHYTNLQLLKRIDNRKKSAKL